MREITLAPQAVSSGSHQLTALTRRVPLSLQTMLLSLVIGLVGCSDQTKQELNEFAHSRGVKALADVGQQLIDAGNHVLSEVPVSHSPVDLPTQVFGRGEVGHRDFAAAKQVLPRIYSGVLREEFYCGCDYRDKSVDFQSCGYVPRQNAERASRIEWEHVVPAWNIGHQRRCWQQGGRKHCQETDPQFRLAEGDLVNLVPSVGEVNGDRSNFSFGAWDRQPRPIYGRCETVVDFDLKRAQPRTAVRGRIARIYFYMYGRYQLRMSRQDMRLMCAWAKAYPVDAWERERDQRIRGLQGSGNAFVQAAELPQFCA